MNVPPTAGAPMGDSLDSTFGFRRMRRVIRNLLLITFVVMSLVDFFGEPFLRWEYRYQGQYSKPYITDATYIGFSGKREVIAGEFSGSCPLLLLIKPKPSLWGRTFDYFTSLMP